MNTARDGLRLLESLGASPWLLRHHELVVEAATLLCDRLVAPFDRDAVLLGASIHDAGKILHPEEMSVAGNLHEAAGQRLLVEHGVPLAIARFCVTHASWNVSDCTLEDLLVAVADKLWKGKRVDALEQLVVTRIVSVTGEPPWSVFERVDALCEAIAADGPDRLSRSVV